MNKSFVFKVERPSINIQAQLRNGESIELEILESNANQLAELESQKDTLKGFELTKKHLSENIKGEKKDEFIVDLLENGSLADFYTAINEQFRAIKGAKRKN